MMQLLSTLALTVILLLPPPCATISFVLGASTLQVGQTQTITTTVTNCGTEKIKLRTTVTITDAIGNTTLLRNSAQMYNAGQTVVFNDDHDIPATGPTGTWRVITIVFDGSQGGAVEVARDVEEFQVTN